MENRRDKRRLHEDFAEMRAQLAKMRAMCAEYSWPQSLAIIAKYAFRLTYAIPYVLIINAGNLSKALFVIATWSVFAAGRFAKFLLSERNFSVGQPFVLIFLGALVTNKWTLSFFAGHAFMTVAFVCTCGAGYAAASWVNSATAGYYLRHYEACRFRFLSVGEMLKGLGLPPLREQLNRDTCYSDEMFAEFKAELGAKWTRPILLAQPTRVGDPLPLRNKAFASWKEAYVFFTQPVEKARGFGRFVLLHELHHAMISGAIQSGFMVTGKWVPYCAVLIYMLLDPAQLYLLLGITCGGVLMVLRTAKADSQYMKLNAELLADHFAARHSEPVWFNRGTPEEYASRLVSSPPVNRKEGEPSDNIVTRSWWRIPFAVAERPDDWIMEKRREKLIKLIDSVQRGLGDFDEALVSDQDSRLRWLDALWHAMLIATLFAFGLLSGPIGWAGVGVFAFAAVASWTALAIVDYFRLVSRAAIANAIGVPEDILPPEVNADHLKSMQEGMGLHPATDSEETGQQVRNFSDHTSPVEPEIHVPDEIPFYAVSHVTFCKQERAATLVLSDGAEVRFHRTVPDEELAAWSHARAVQLRKLSAPEEEERVQLFQASV